MKRLTAALTLAAMLAVLCAGCGAERGAGVRYNGMDYTLDNDSSYTVERHIIHSNGHVADDAYADSGVARRNDKTWASYSTGYPAVTAPRFAGRNIYNENRGLADDGTVQNRDETIDRDTQLTGTDQQAATLETTQTARAFRDALA